MPVRAKETSTSGANGKATTQCLEALPSRRGEYTEPRTAEPSAKARASAPPLRAPSPPGPSHAQTAEDSVQRRLSNVQVCRAREKDGPSAKEARPLPYTENPRQRTLDLRPAPRENREAAPLAVALNEAAALIERAARAAGNPPPTASGEWVTVMAAWKPKNPKPKRRHRPEHDR